MRKAITFLLLFAICASQVLWSHNYCMSCALGSSAAITQNTTEHKSCCSSRVKTQTKQKKCTSCGDNCKCSSLETDDKLNHSLVSFEFSITVDYLELYTIPATVSDVSRHSEQAYTKDYITDSAPPPLIKTVLSTVILRV